MVSRLCHGASRHILTTNACVGDKDYEISVGDIENATILPGENFMISSCGRSDSASGTEGEFEIYEDGGGKVRHFYWSCPWGSKINTWRITGMKHLVSIHPSS